MTHHGTVGAITENQADGIDQDGFAGAGLAGHDAQAMLQFQLQLFDDSKIPYVQVG